MTADSKFEHETPVFIQMAKFYCETKPWNDSCRCLLAGIRLSNATFVQGGNYANISQSAGACQMLHFLQTRMHPLYVWQRLIIFALTESSII